MLGVYLTTGGFEELYPPGAQESVLFKRAYAADLNPDCHDVAAGMPEAGACLVRDWGGLQKRPDLLLPLLEWDTAGLMVHVQGVGVAHCLSVRTICRSYQPMQVIPYSGDEHIFSVRDEWGAAMELAAVSGWFDDHEAGVDFSHGQVIRVVGGRRGMRGRFEVFPLNQRTGVTFEVKFK